MQQYLDSLKKRISSHDIKKLKGVTTDIRKVMEFIPKVSEDSTRWAIFAKHLYSQIVGDNAKYKGLKFKKFIKDVNAGKIKPTREQIFEAGLAARAGTVDRGIAGASARRVNPYSPFFTARIAGVRDLVANATGKDRKKFFLKGMLLLALPSIALYLANRNNPAYQELPDWVKDTHWCFVMSDDLVLTIPKPFTIGIVFGSFFERLTEWIINQDPKAFDGFGRNLFVNTMPGVSPALVTPLVELVSNYSFFLRREIVPKSEQHLEKADQYGVFTSDTAIIIGHVLKMSPRHVDNLIQNTTSTYGRTVTDMIDLVLGLAFADERAKKPQRSLAQYPVLRRFFFQTYTQASSVDEFYRAYEIASRNPDSPEFRAFSRAASNMSNVRRAMKRIYGNFNMSAEEKARELEDLNLRLVNYARRALGKSRIPRS